jgi:DNA invertase Pin-like site-specific DNA recombinase
MSTEHQQYSTENQADAIRLYADRHGLEIVRTYADEGRSRLRIEGRDALQRLIADVESGTADLGAVLVYDVSRWAGFRMRTRAPTTSTAAGGRGSTSTIAPSSSRTTGGRSRRSSRA